MKQFKVSEVKCNGVGGQGYQAVLKHKEQIQAICQEVRNVLGLDQLYALATVDESSDYYSGSRFNSVEDNAYRLISGIARHCSTYLESDELIEMHVPSVLKTLTFQDKVTLVVDACRDCAGADHWYTFEKQWD
tara:strand:+ start:1261 stop:1659 length:399 start_codon:yes stop_codon:yes gene_type:complete